MPTLITGVLSNKPSEFGRWRGILAEPFVAMKMKIRVKIMDQTDHPFEVDDQILLSEFRLQVAERLNIPPERQRMIFAGHVLKAEDNTLAACGLQDGHVVHLVERPADMPFPPSEGETSATRDHDNDHNHHHRPVRFLQNMFGPQTNERERVTYVIPFERSGILEENSRIEELVRSAIERIPYLTDDQRSRFNMHWDSNNTLHLALPSQRNPHIASPALERIALIETFLEQIAHFHTVAEEPGGLADRIDEFLEGSHIYDRENTTVMNDQLRSIAVTLEREVLSRSRLIDALSNEETDLNESDEHEARFQRAEESEGNPGYVMRHALASDLVDILRRLQAEHEALRSHFLRFDRILSSLILYDIDDEEHSDTDYRANFFTVYMEHLQRTVHRFSHAWHLASDLSVYLHTPMPRRLLPNYQQFRLLPPTEGQIILEFRPPQGGTQGQATTNEPSARFLDMPPPGVDVAELTNQEVRIMGLNPTVRRMQQMGIAVPVPIPPVGQVNVQAGGPSGPPRIAQRRFMPLQRNSPLQVAFRQATGTLPGFASASSSGSHSEPPRVEQTTTRTSQNVRNCLPSSANRPFTRSLSDVGSSSSVSPVVSLERDLLDALEQALPSGESNNPYERIMRRLLQLANDRSQNASNVLQSASVRQAFSRVTFNPEPASLPSSTGTNTQEDIPNQQGQVPRLGTLARGVITQSSGEMPFVSEVLSNIMRNNGITGGIPPQVDVYVEYGSGDQNPGMPAIPPQMLNMPMNGAPAEPPVGRQPTAVGYHVEVHQFDVFTNPPEQNSQNPVQNGLPPSSTASSSTPANGSISMSTTRPPIRSGYAQNRQRHPTGFPFLMGNMGFPTDLHVTAPRQEVVNVDPFLSCSSRFTDVQRVLRNNNPSVTTQLSPYRQFMRNMNAAPANSDRRFTPIDGYERVMLGLNASMDVLMSDENNFESFLHLAIRSALSLMVHADQDRNSQNARGTSPHVFSMGQSMQLPGGGELVQVSTPILVHAEVEHHVDTNQEDTTSNRPAENGTQDASEDTPVQPRFDFIPHDAEGRNILTEMANAMTAGLDTRISTILDASHAPASMLRPGNGAGVLAHLEALLLSFATLGDLANVININMTPLEQHRSRFRSHVIENQLNGNSTPSEEDLLSASERLAALRSSISSVICSAGGALEREWNGRQMNISETIRNVEIATIQQLLRALLDRNISDAEFSHRIQNCLRDYVRQLVALGNHCFVDADETAYVRILYEILMRADVESNDANLTALLHLRNSIFPRVAAFLREQGRFPNLDEIPSRLLAWAIMNDGAVNDEATNRCVQSTAQRSLPYDQSINGAREDQDFDELAPSTSRGSCDMFGATYLPGRDPLTGAHLQDYDGDWRRSFPDWLEIIERDSLSAQTNPRQHRNHSDVYQLALPEHMRRQVVSGNTSERDVLVSALQESLNNALRGNTPPVTDELVNSPAAMEAINELLGVAIQHRLEDDPDYDPSRYPETARKFERKP
ncbi:hypothetical protein RB195_003879 [Necator americanus]|uniref:Ubiquitin-like domain-containing protein n=2 Tax=Necator americanus TaxID=51031 RepID=A0ABR1DQM7_NECAM